MVSHRLQDGFTLAAHHFDPQANQMRPIAGAGLRDTRTSFLILRDGRKIFDGTARELAESRDEYIREYIA